MRKIANSIDNIQSNKKYIECINNFLSKYTYKKILLSVGAQSNSLNMFKLDEDMKSSLNIFFQDLFY